MSTIIRDVGYRPDIDGLRAVAVLLVVLYHAGVKSFPGGFIGVDVFFVISGYLITAIINNEIRAGTFTFSRFYERRARRLFPALFAMLGACLFIGYFAAIPSDYELIGEATIATLFFLSNLFFLNETGYFNVGAEHSYLLHTWSLGVEEQFYLLFPVMLVVIHRFGRRYLVTILSISMSVSFVACVVGTELYPNATFFLAPTRAWELLLGSLLALGRHKAPPSLPVSMVGGVIGLGLIFAAALLLDAQSAFPGVAASLPSLGAASIIWSGANPGSPVNRLLCVKPLVYIGLLSYSLYLWHLPIILFARDFLGGAASIMAGAIVTSLCVSALSQKFVEKPFRGSRGGSKRKVAFGGGLVLCSLVAIASVIAMSGGLPARVPGAVLESDAVIKAGRNPLNSKCRESGIPLSDQYCVIGAEGESPTFAVWGDSHATVISPGIIDAANRYGHTGQLLAHPGCPPVLDVSVGRRRDCAADNATIIQYLETSPRINLVFLAARWTRYQREDGATGLLSMISGRGTDNLQLLGDGLRESIKRLRAAGIRVVVISQVPEADTNIPNALARAAMRGRETASVDLTMQEHLTRNSRLSTIWQELTQGNSELDIVHPHELMCDGSRCQTEVDGIPIYFDSHHLTVDGARRLRSLFEPYFISQDTRNPDAP
ncbi:MAG: acyltransferase family protein [Gammaproteobacteria bacterium]